jgi:hypothetical protein
MSTRKLLFVFWLFASSFSMAYGADLTVGYPYLQPTGPSSHRSINAAVIKVVDGLAFLRTEDRSIRTIGVKEVKSDGIPSLQPARKVDLIVDSGNSILDVAEAGGKGGFLGKEVSGTILRLDRLDKRITLKTGEGRIRSFELGDAVATKLNWIEKGRTITLELNGNNRAIDAYQR